MKIFIDTADLEEIKNAFSWGIVDGITTNPSLIKKAMEKLKKEGKEITLEEYIKKILEIAGERCPVSLEVIALDEKGMCREAKKLQSKFGAVSRNVVVKIPINPALAPADSTNYDGLKVIKSLRMEGIRTNATLIMTPEQALLAANAGADYVSPFAGRIDDYLRANMKIKAGKADYYCAEGALHEGAIVEDNGIVSGVDLIGQTVEILKPYKTEVIAASIRNARQARECALAGSHIATIPFDVLKQMITHPKTYEGMLAFKNDTVEEYRKVF